VQVTTSRRRIPRVGTIASLGVRLLFAWVAFRLTTALLTVPFADEEREAGRLFVGGLAWVCFGMAVPWRKFLTSPWIPSERVRALAARLEPPGPNLAFLSKLLGWMGTVLILVPLVDDPAWIGIVGLAATVSALALWARVTWARWVWALVGVGLVLSSMRLVWPFVRGPVDLVARTTEAGWELHEVLFWFLGVPLLVGAIGVRVLQELVRAPRAQSR
jgi:hypothetical protein